jgi:hypothetical protein
VTPLRRPATASERKRLQRQRERSAAAPIHYEREDWQLFLDAETLPQKAGCHPDDLERLVLKELADNALDAGAEVAISYDAPFWRIVDDGPGLSTKQIPSLFSVNRPLRSSKLKRLPTRGALGNGLRVVAGAAAALDGALMVESRGHRLTLTIDRSTGQARVVHDEPVPHVAGTAVTISLPFGDGRYGNPDLAEQAVRLAQYGEPYSGPSSPWWYAPADLWRLLQYVPSEDITVADVCRDLGVRVDDDRPARSLSKLDAAMVLHALQAMRKPVRPQQLGELGATAFGYCAGYASKRGEARVSRAALPYVVEAWAGCVQPEDGPDGGEVPVYLHVNRTPTLARLAGWSASGRLGLHGCGLDHVAKAPTGHYSVAISLIVPYVQLTTEGKEPDLRPFLSPILDTVGKACRQAHHALDRPTSWSIKDAAYRVMEAAYMKASAGGTLPANARQVMYAARPEILRLTGKTKLDDAYFTQRLLPNYVNEHAAETTDWDVVFDSRGSFMEPHTGVEFGLGTIEVRQYLGERAAFGPAVAVRTHILYPTHGPEHRFNTVLFVEKEGFFPLLQAAAIAERFDIAITSTKGMTVTAARLLFDRVVERGVKRVLVLHDFDVSGFSIFGTLGTTNRRYTFANKVPMVDLGLRLADVREMGLQAEPHESKGDWEARSETLRRHGASWDEIEFLQRERVELNMMTSDVFVAFPERKLREHGVGKIMPDRKVLQAHWQRLQQQQLGEQLIEQHRERIEQAAASVKAPDNLEAKLRAVMAKEPTLSWDQAVHRLMTRRRR